MSPVSTRAWPAPSWGVLVLSALSALVAIAVWVGLAHFADRGHGWALVVLAVPGGLALLSAASASASPGSTASGGLPRAVPVGVVVTRQVLGLGLWASTLVLLHRPASNAFFRDAAAVRAARGHVGPVSAHQPS